MSQTNPPPDPRLLIFGAGRIGRGFLGHMAQRSGFAVTFVEPNPAVVERLNRDRHYRVYVMGAPEKDDTVRNVQALLLGDFAVARAIMTHDVLATAVGGQNLPLLGKALTAGLIQRMMTQPDRPIDILVCENFKNAAGILQQSILDAGGPLLEPWARAHVGIVETQILKTCTLPDPAKHPGAGELDVQVENAWRLPCDRAGFRGPIPPLLGLDPQDDFRFSAVRKLYTYNCTNAVIAYLGHLRNYHWLCEAANDPDIHAVALRVIDETRPAYVAEFAFDPAQQQQFHETALKKYRDRNIQDPVARNARDSKRKLGSDDRLVGPAQLVLKHGGEPTGLALGIAAALHYVDANDPPTSDVQISLRTQGVPKTLQTVCGLAPADPLVSHIITSIPRLAPFNRRGVPLLQT